VGTAPGKPVAERGVICGARRRRHTRRGRHRLGGVPAAEVPRGRPGPGASPVEARLTRVVAYEILEAADSARVEPGS